MAKKAAKLTITQFKSGIGHPEDQRKTLRSLGFHRLNQTIMVEDNASVRGMIFKVRHLVKVEEVSGEAK